MATKKTAATKTQPTTTASKTRTLAVHEIAMSSIAQNAIGISSWSKFAGVADLGELVKDLNQQVEQVNNGELGSLEAMLFGQAKVLETMFTNLARRAANSDGLNQFQCNLTLALKAQAQCRATLEALAEIKNPRTVAFVNQANMTTGPQQVNNGISAGFREQCTQAHARAEDSQSEPNKLLETNHGKRLDTRAKGTAGRTNQAVEAMG